MVLRTGTVYSMGTVPITLIALFLVGLTGWYVGFGWHKRAEGLAIWEALPVAFGLGSGVIGLAIFFLLWLRIGLSLPSVSTLAAFLAYSSRRLLLASLGSWGDSDARFISESPAISRGAGRWLETTVSALFAFQVLFSVALALLGGASLGYDAIRIWATKSKVLYLTQELPDWFFKSPENYAHVDYPLLLPLMEVWGYILAGRVDEGLIPLLSSAYFLMLCVAFFGFARRAAGSIVAGILGFLLASVPQIGSLHTASGYADIPLAFYFLVAIGSLLAWMRSRHPRDLIIGAGCLGLTAWVKNEGLPCILVVWMALLLIGCGTTRERRNFWRSSRLVVLVSGAIALPWLLFGWSRGLESDLAPGRANLLSGTALRDALVRRAGLVLSGFGTAVFSPSNVLTRWNLVWVLVVAAVGLGTVRGFPRQALFPWCVVFGQTGVYFLLYLVTPHDVVWHMLTSMDRLLIHLCPIALLAIAHQLSPAESSGAEGTDFALPK